MGNSWRRAARAAQVLELNAVEVYNKLQDPKFESSVGIDCRNQMGCQDSGQKWENDGTHMAFRVLQ